ncbi:reverse transcriptase [Phytophthora megakarya]|uniref:Reverse transcriptase n=1 Tax=Phytophthora megakarya TaxID=4795 RepID=A0A225UYQ7_9STRA|nr:reverse transcriptase [Phytophthora megakarya]
MGAKIALVLAVERPEYETPRMILPRPKTALIQRRKVKATVDKSPSEIRPLDLASVASEEPDLSSIADEDSILHVVTVNKALEDFDQATADIWATNPLVRKLQTWKECEKRMTEMNLRASVRINYIREAKIKEHLRRIYVAKMDVDPSPVVEDQPGTSDLDLTWDSDQDYDECVYYHEGNAEDVDDQMAVLPEVPVTTEDVWIKAIQLCESDNQTPEEIDRLCQRIWKFRHLLIGKGNALPPAARGVVCDIDVGGASPIALKCRKLRIQFREKLADLIKGLLSAKIINYSRSPWASPIAVIIKKNGVDIMLCIDYRLVNSLTQLMI